MTREPEDTDLPAVLPEERTSPKFDKVDMGAKQEYRHSRYFHERRSFHLTLGGGLQHRGTRSLADRAVKRDSSTYLLLVFCCFFISLWIFFGIFLH